MKLISGSRLILLASIVLSFCWFSGMADAAAPSAQEMPVTINGGTIVTPMNDVVVTGTATLVKAATANRSALSCTNTSASVNVRWGDATVTATKGQQIKAGASVEIRNVGDVYMASEGANVPMSCTEELS